MNTCALALAAVFAARAAYGADLAHQIRQALESTPAARRAFWGIQIVDLKDGKTLFENNAERCFVPASNTKLFSTALGLMRLGPDYKFQTIVRAEGKDLILYGGGDPNMSGRTVPYQAKSQWGNSVAAIEALADQIVAHGVRRVQGDIVGDDTWYQHEPYAPAWDIDYPIYEYGAPVSALTLNDNTQWLTLTPGAQEGDVARVTLSPEVEFFEVDNRVTTTRGAERRIHVERMPGERRLHVWGAIGPGDPAFRMQIGVDDPAQYAAQALADALWSRGVVIDGGVRARHWYPQVAAPPAPSGETVASRESLPLIEDLKVTDKVSQNLHAELILRAVGKAKKGTGRRQDGLQEMKTFLDEVGVEADQYSFGDGSGLTRQNLVSPAAVVKLLRYMYAQPLRDQWIELLPVGGVDGTLSSRFANSPAHGRIHAKTGTLSHVTALSGYAERKSGGMVAFSILVNNSTGSSGDIRAVVDKICNLIVE